MADDEKILAIMRATGPVLPVDIAKGLKTNILLASAYLSELVARKKIKITKVKIGGSPLYYMSGQEAKLEHFADNLNEKELRAYEVLKEKKVLRDEQLTPLMRVALRQINDFAAPLNVTFEGKQELFWKWYMLNDEEVTPIIRKELGIEEKKEEVVPTVSEAIEKVKEAVKEEIASKRRGRPRKEVERLETRQERLKKTETIEEPKIESKPKIEKSRIETKELKPKIETKVEELKREKPETKSKLVQETENGFITAVQNFFKQKEITILSEEVVKKNAEMSYVVKIPSPVGELQYLCKVTNKKKSTDKDISSALVEGQLKRVPVVYLHSGSLSPKAQQMIKTEPFKTMTFFKLSYGR